MVCLDHVFQMINLNLHLTGILVAWMLSLSSTQVTIKFFLKFVKTASLTIIPVIIMSDHNKAQMNAISTVYPESKMLLCWWHVLRAIQMHFHTEEFPEDWAHICEWKKMPEQWKFDSIWEWLQTNPSVPVSLINYLQTHWMSVVPLWLGTMRQNRMIFQEGSTNMLIKLYVILSCHRSIRSLIISVI